MKERKNSIFAITKIKIMKQIIECVPNFSEGRDLNKIKDVIILDDYKIPVKIDNVQDFFDDISDLYQRNLNSYWVEYNKLEKSKGEILKDD